MADDDIVDFVAFGTPLEPFEEDDVTKKKPVAISDQIVTDERGKRRFHGAFTGGFSAGYFNTVGSKEGWTPTAFKSSRCNRATTKNQNVQDFMDEEDLGSFGIAPQVLRPTDNFTYKDNDDLNSKKTPSAGTIPGIPVFEKMLEPVRDTIGITILLKMGWRKGKGIGPKVKRKKIKNKELSTHYTKASVDQANESVDEANFKVYGCALPESLKTKYDIVDSESSSEDENLYAPDDIENTVCEGKNNRFGLGYSGLRAEVAISQGLTPGSEVSGMFGSKKLSFRGQAFGVGAFETEDADIYSRDDASQYDLFLETPEERRNRKRLEKFASSKHSNHAPGVIEGFKPATSKGLLLKYFPPPKLPVDFQPIRKARKSRFDIPPSRNEFKKHGPYSLSERKAILQDESDKSGVRERSCVEKPSSSTESKSKLTSSHLDDNSTVQARVQKLKKFTEVLQRFSSQKSEPNATGGSFKPFMKNPEKQERYENFLTLRKAGFRECLSDLQPIKMTEWEREKEQTEFERAAALYDKPMSGAISSRFVSAKSHDISHLAPEKAEEQLKDPKDDPKVAASLEMYGKLTHKVIEWHPDKILCKRFNIRNPFPNSTIIGCRVSASDIINSKAAAITYDKEKTTQQLQMPEEIKSHESIEKSKPLQKKSLFEDLDFSKPPSHLVPVEKNAVENINKAEIVKDELSDVQSVLQKPSIDFFKQIFADSESDDSGGEDEETEHSKNISLEKSACRSKSNSPSRMKGPPEISKKNTALQIPPTPTDEKKELGETIVSEIKDSMYDDNGLDYYGPKPLNISKKEQDRERVVFNRVRTAPLVCNSASLPSLSKQTSRRLKVEEDEFEWIEKSEASSSHRKKVKKKAKDKKTKKKKDKKKHKSGKRKCDYSKHSPKAKKSKMHGEKHSDDSDSTDSSTSSMKVPAFTTKSLISKLKMQLRQS